MPKPSETAGSAATLEILCEPGAIQIDAVAELAAGGEGKAPLPRFSMVAYTGGPMRIAGWQYPVIVDLAGLAIPSQNRPIRFGHDMASGVGHTDAIRVEQGRLVAMGVVSRDTAAAREIVISARNDFPWQASIGAAVEEFEFIKSNQTVVVNGRDFLGPVNVVRRATLGEISFVDLGADGQTSASVAAMSSPHTQEEQPVPENDPNNTVSDPPAAPSSQGSQTTAQASAPTAPAATAMADETRDGRATGQTAVEEIRAAAAAESARIAAVRRICGTDHPTIEARAIREGWDTMRTELEVLRASRPTAPAMHVRAETVSAAVLEAAGLLTAKLDGIENLFGQQALEAAQRRFRGGIGLQELILEAAWANGYTGRSFRDSRTIMRFAFKPELEAGFSTIDIGGILSNVANKFLLEGFFAV
ncbi:MAG TPA: hypothetical protein DD670_14140, partial [Planctomycetaceae bacterium]|nr:hypothetical protein [Planctomycetaceae bacterium]